MWAESPNTELSKDYFAILPQKAFCVSPFFNGRKTIVRMLKKLTVIDLQANQKCKYVWFLIVKYQIKGNNAKKLKRMRSWAWKRPLYRQ